MMTTDVTESLWSPRWGRHNLAQGEPVAGDALGNGKKTASPERAIQQGVNVGPYRALTGRSKCCFYPGRRLAGARLALG